MWDNYDLAEREPTQTQRRGQSNEFHLVPVELALAPFRARNARFSARLLPLQGFVYRVLGQILAKANKVGHHTSVGINPLIPE